MTQPAVAGQPILASHINYLYGDNAWTNASYGTGWSTAGGWFPASYRKLGDVVYLRGRCNWATGGQSTVFTLPVGYRPALPCRFLLWHESATYRYVDINSNGNVSVDLINVNGQDVSLNGIMFDTLA